MPEKYYSLNPKIYDDQFWWKKDDVEFWKILFSNKNKAILELACGSGRLGIPLIKEGVKYTGLDISKQYCQHAINKVKTYTDSKIIYNYDMRNFKLNNTFDNIFIGFNSWLHLFNEADVFNCLKSVKLHMNSKSKFYIDIFVPNPLFLYRPKDIALPILEYYDSKKKSMVYIDEILDYNRSNEIASITWLYKNKKKYFMEFNFQMKMYYPDTMFRLLTDNNFIIKNIWGNYQKEAFSEDSSQQIYECQIKV